MKIKQDVIFNLNEATPSTHMEACSIYEIGSLSRSNSKTILNPSHSEAQILPPNRLMRTKSIDSMKGNKLLFKLKGKRNENRISRISSLLGKIFENKIEQIENHYGVRERKPSFDNNSYFETVSNTCTWNTLRTISGANNYRDKLGKESIKMVRSRRSSIGEKISHLISEINSDEPSNTIVEPDCDKEKDFKENYIQKRGLPPKSSRLRSYSKDIEYINPLTERRVERQLKFSDCELKVMRTQSFVNCVKEEDNPKQNSQKMNLVMVREIENNLALTPKDNMKNVEIDLTKKSDHETIFKEKTENNNAIKLNISCEKKLIPQVEKAKNSPNDKKNPLSLLTIPIPTYKKPLVKGKIRTLNHQKSCSTFSETKFNDTPSTVDTTAQRKKLNKRNNFTLSNTFVGTNNEIFSSDKIKKIEKPNETSEDTVVIVPPGDKTYIQSVPALYSYMSESTYDNILFDHTEKELNLSQDSLDLVSVSLSTNKKQKVDYSADETINLPGENFKTENNSTANTMREKIIKDLEAFKLSNVNEKLNCIYKKYQQLESKQSASPKKLKNENLLRSEKQSDYEPYELDNTLRSISINALKQLIEPKLQMTRVAEVNLNEERVNTDKSVGKSKSKVLSISNIKIESHEQKNLKIIKSVKGKETNNKNSITKEKVLSNSKTKTNLNNPNNLNKVSNLSKIKTENYPNYLSVNTTIAIEKESNIVRSFSIKSLSKTSSSNKLTMLGKVNQESKHNKIPNKQAVSGKGLAKKN